MTPEELMDPPTEIDISHVLAWISNVRPGQDLTASGKLLVTSLIRRLAFERDRLRAELAKTKKDLSLSEDAVFRLQSISGRG